jgi:hypothetical protein
MSATTIKTDTQCKVRCGAPSSDGTLPLLLREDCLFILFFKDRLSSFAGPVVYGSATVVADSATVGYGLESVGSGSESVGTGSESVGTGLESVGTDSESVGADLQIAIRATLIKSLGRTEIGRSNRGFLAKPAVILLKPTV